MMNKIGGDVKIKMVDCYFLLLGKVDVFFIGVIVWRWVI